MTNKEMWLDCLRRGEVEHKIEANLLDSYIKHLQTKQPLILWGEECSPAELLDAMREGIESREHRYKRDKQKENK